MYYTTRTGRWPLTRTRTPATVPRPASWPQEHLCDPYGWWGMPNLVGRCTLPQVAQGHCRHRYPSHTAACGMRSRPRGALLVLPADPSMRRGHHWASRPSTRTTSLGVVRSFSMLGGHARTMETYATFTPVDLPGQRAPWALRRRAGSAGPQRPCRSRVDTLGPHLVSLRRSTAGGALRVRHGVTSIPVKRWPAAARCRPGLPSARVPERGSRRARRG